MTVMYQAPIGADLHAHDSTWTGDIPDSGHLQFFKSVDWAATDVGPLGQWSHALRLYVYQLFAESRPVIIYWGPNKTAIYNEAFVPLAGKAHPSLMGQGFQQGFPEIWDNIKPVFDSAESSKRATDVIQTPLVVERSGYLEETIFTGTFSPLRGDDGRVSGFYNALSEVTRQTLTDRRRAVLDLMSSPAEVYTAETVGSHIVESLLTNTLDVPLALLYQVSGHTASRGIQLSLRGTIGIPEHHKLAVSRANLDSDEGVFPFLRRAQQGIITVPTGPEFAGVHWAGHGEPSTHISALPLSSAGRLYGFLVLGVNPRRPIDEDHDHFLRDLSEKLSSTIAFAVSIEESLKLQQRLQSQLAESERHIRYMAQHLDIGMEHLTLEGKLIWANECFYKLINRQDRQNLEAHTLPFRDQVLSEDRPKITDAWKRVIQGEKQYKLELRMKQTFLPPSGDPVPATILFSAFPYVEDGEIRSIMACMTDVSGLKWAESLQARVAQEAQEAKRRQSEFTDAISHEVRNPLSAILQLADSIAGCLEASSLQNLSLEECKKLVEENIDAARTILICAHHQKRIVDDVLTLSKMDFMLMVLSPTAVRPTDLADGALKILAADIASSHIKLDMTSDHSLEALGIKWVLCDSLRVTQILINLLSNAIKFTKREDRREIHIIYGASKSDPRQALPHNILWASPKAKKPEDVTLGEAWGSGESIYLTFLIRDTGPGMTEEELRRLFNRFEQASPRTSIKYGGSGLGLFISHSLSEKQGGSIGVASQPGRGSTFAFYIKARRGVTPPSPPLEAADQNVLHVDEQLATAEANLSDLSIAVPNEVSDHYNRFSNNAYHLLLVEDNIVNQRILLKQLLKAGCVVHVANHGVEALDILQTSSRWTGSSNTDCRVDIVLMDWEMPVMDGLTCSRAIRSHEQSGQLKERVGIIAITANVRQEQVDKALAAGIDAVMPKPFAVSDLLDMIKQRLGR